MTRTNRFFLLLGLLLVGGQVLLAPVSQALQTNAIACVSAANYSPNYITFHSIVAVFGTQLATTTASGGNTDPTGPKVVLPTTLGGTTVKVAGIEAPLFFVSPGQVNFAVPPSLTAGQLDASGTVAVEIRAGNGVASSGRMSVAKFAPAAFTYDATGHGIPAGLSIRVKPDNQQVWEGLADYDRANNNFIARPVNLGVAGDRMFLSLFLSGIRGATDTNGDGNSNENIYVLINNTEVVPQYAGAQPSLVGLDQLNIEIPTSLYGLTEFTLTIHTRERADQLLNAPLTFSLRAPDVPNVIWVARGLTNQTVRQLVAAGTQTLASTATNLFTSLNHGATWDELQPYGEPLGATAVYSTAYDTRLLFASAGSAFGLNSFPGAFPKTASTINALYGYGDVGAPNFPIATSAGLLAGTETGLFNLSVKMSGPPPRGLPEYSWTDIPPLSFAPPILALEKNLVGTRGKGLYRLTAQNTWQQITQVIPTNANINKLAVSRQYAFAAREDQGLYRSLNFGATWQAVTGAWPSGEFITGLRAYGQNVVVTTRTNGVYVSNDYGQTWRAINQGLGNQRVLSVALDEFRLMVGTENGVYAASNFGIGTNVLIAPERNVILDEDTSVTFSLREGNNNPATTSYLLSSQPDIGTLSVSPTNLTYVPPPNYFGTQTFTYAASDGRLVTPRAKVTITVRPVNDAPSLTLGELTAKQVGENITLRLNLSDPDGETPLVTFTSTPAGITGNVAVYDRFLSFNGRASQAGSYTLTFTATDSGGLKATASVPLTVSDNPEKTAWTARPLAVTQPYNDLLVSGDNWFVGTRDGVFRSTNAGASWTYSNAGLPLATYGISHLAQSGNVLLASYDGYGIYRSTDGGATWTQTLSGGSPNFFTQELIANGDRVLVLAGESVFLSTDRGSAWEQLAGLLNAPITGIAISNTHLFAFWRGKGIYRSADNGATWTSFNHPLPIGDQHAVKLRFLGSTLYSSQLDTYWRSTDAGQTWTPFPTPKVGSYVTSALDSMILVGNDLFYAAQSIGVWVQRNSTGPWLPINLGLPLPFTVQRLAANNTQLVLLRYEATDALFVRPLAR